MQLEDPLHLLPGPSHASTQPTVGQREQPFISFLSDIPKLPKFEVKLEEPTNNHRRPPPSKGLSIAKKFNDNISLVPHELSTIAEADSQLSAKLGNKFSPNTSASSLKVSPLKDVDVKLPSPAQKFCEFPVENQEAQSSINDDVDCFKGTKSFTLQNKSGVSDSSNSKSFRSSKESSKQHSSSSDDIEAIESMLKSIGMEWAIPTLHKTREALALSSSSSSLDLSLKQRIFGNDSNDSPTSLKALLSKHLMGRISSSTLISDTSPVSILGEITDISAIQGTSREQQRTSTPLTGSKNKSTSKEVFSMESDISSVKNTS